MAGIKFHGAIDTIIEGNHIYRANHGLWLDWMTQGTRVSGNLFHDNIRNDLFIEMNHGPFLVDNNLLLSAGNLLDMSQGGAYVHNLFAGTISWRSDPRRVTPYHLPHSTALAGEDRIWGGDNRFYGNIFVGQDKSAGVTASTGGSHHDLQLTGCGLCVYDEKKLPLQTGGNVYCNGARPSVDEVNPLVLANVDPKIEIAQADDRTFLQFEAGPELKLAVMDAVIPVTFELLGKVRIANLAFEDPDGSTVVIERDYFGRPRLKPFLGPIPNLGSANLEVWPTGKP